MDIENIRAQLDMAGYAVVEGIDEPSAMQIASLLGRIIPDPRTKTLIREIRPQPREEANPNTLSSRYGIGAFPFHTEAAYLRFPPGFVLLYCEAPGSGNRPTLLLDTRQLIDALSATRPPTWIVKSGRAPFLCSVVVRSPIKSLRYDAACMLPCGPAAVQQRDAIEHYIGSHGKSALSWQPKMLAVIDNRHMLHGRGYSSQVDTDRILRRIIVA